MSLHTNIIAYDSTISIVEFFINTRIQVIILHILLQRGMVNIRLWITEQVLPLWSTEQTSTSRNRLWISLIFWCIAAASLFLYPWILEQIGYNTLAYNNINIYPNFTVILLLIGYIVCIVLLESLVSRNKPVKHIYTSPWLFIYTLLIWCLLLWWSYVLLGYIHIAPIILYYVLVAASEEGLKYLSSIHLFRKHALSKSDLILYSLLTAIGFAFFENIVYIANFIPLQDGLISRLLGSTSLGIKRWLVWFMVHMLFTWSIAWVVYLSTQYTQATIKRIGWYMLALVSGIWLHLLYNLFAYYQSTLGVLLFIMWGYILISRLFWKSDRLYIDIE